MAFGYYSPLNINAAQVPTTQTDFPVLVSVTDARLKTGSHGGHVQNSSGFDIRPYTDSTIGTAITGYELERYNGSSGEVIMWVKVSSLSSSTTPFVLAYGDATISTDGSSSTTWSNSFSGVFHLKDGTTLNITDSTGTISGTNNSATAASGQIDGAGGFSGVSQFILYNTGIPSLTSATVSAWVNATSFPNAYNAPIYKSDASAKHWGILVKSTGKLALFYSVVPGGDVSYDGTGSHTLTTGTWFYLTATYSSATGLIGYVNAASDGTAAANGNLTNGVTLTMDIGQDAGAGSRFWNGTLDEVRVASVARSADWITTEYNNQSAPGTFETLGTEVSIAPFAGLYTK